MEQQEEQPPRPAPTFAEWSLAVKRCLLFSTRSAAEIKYVHKTTRLLEATAEAHIFDEGDTPSTLYIVHSGLYRASSSRATTLSARGGPETWWRSPLRDFGPLDHFGACELLTQMGDRACTIAVVEPGWLWCVPQRVVVSTLKIPPLTALSCKGELQQVLQSTLVFGNLPRDRLVQLCRGAAQVDIAPGEVIFTAGDAATHLYLVVSGIVTLSHEPHLNEELHPAQPFGEATLFPGGYSSTEEHRTRIHQATAHADVIIGASLLKWHAASLESLIGFELQTSAAACPMLERHSRLLRLLDTHASAGCTSSREASSRDMPTGGGVTSHGASSHRGGPLTEAKKKFQRAAKKALKLESEGYEGAEGMLDGVTREEMIRHYRFHQREEQLLLARAAVYAINERMRESEERRFGEFVATWTAARASSSSSSSGSSSKPALGQARDWSALALNNPSPLVRETPLVATPYTLYQRAMDKAQREYERATSTNGSGVRAASERERLKELLPPEMINGPRSGLDSAASRTTTQRLLRHVLRLAGLEEESSTAV